MKNRRIPHLRASDPKVGAPSPLFFDPEDQSISFSLPGSENRKTPSIYDLRSEDLSKIPIMGSVVCPATCGDCAAASLASPPCTVRGVDAPDLSGVLRHSLLPASGCPTAAERPAGPSATGFCALALRRHDAREASWGDARGMDLTKGAHRQQTRTIVHKTVPASQQKFVAVFSETDQGR